MSTPRTRYSYACLPREARDAQRGDLIDDLARTWGFDLAAVEREALRELHREPDDDQPAWRRAA
jgi:hypothetical protein